MHNFHFLYELFTSTYSYTVLKLSIISFKLVSITVPPSTISSTN